MEWEVSLIEWMQKSLGGVGTTLGKVLSFVGGEMGLLLVLLIVLFCWNKEIGKRLILRVVAVNTWLPMLKTAVLRLRPYMEFPDRVEGHSLTDSAASMKDLTAQGYSFPSMHSASASALYISLAMEMKKKWLWISAVLMTLLVGISRAVVGMHYPTDILAGWALGLLGTGICILLEKKVRREGIRHLILLASALPGLFFVRTQDYFTSLGLLGGMIAASAFEQKYIRFPDTRNVTVMVLRVAGALVIYLVLNQLLKLPFSEAFLSDVSLPAFLVRTARYALMIFLIVGVYPKVFPLYEKIGQKASAKS